MTRSSSVARPWEVFSRLQVDEKSNRSKGSDSHDNDVAVGDVLAYLKVGTVALGFPRRQVRSVLPRRQSKRSRQFDADRVHAYVKDIPVHESPWMEADSEFEAQNNFLGSGSLRP